MWETKELILVNCTFLSGSLTVVHHQLALLRVGSLKVLYSIRSCFLFMQHHYPKSFGTTTWCLIVMLTTRTFTSWWHWRVCWMHWTEIRWMDENKLFEVERLKNNSNCIRFNSTAKENQTVSIACWWLFGQGDSQWLNLDVQLDAEMTMESHVTVVCRSAIFHLRNIVRIRRYLTAAATEQVIH